MIRFISNNCIDIGLENPEAAVDFFKNVMGFKSSRLETGMPYFNTGEICYYIDSSEKFRPPTPSFYVEDLSLAREYLLKSGCAVVREGSDYFWARTSFGFVFDVTEKR